MNYNDFPILNNDEYNLINSHYSNFERFDRKTTIIKIYNEISGCKNICLDLSSKHNPKIKKAIEQAYETLNKLNENLLTSFNLNNTESNTIKTCSLFSFMRKITNLSSSVLEWSKSEKKEYFKSIAQSTMKDLFNIMLNLTSALEESNIILFKHM
ncbi:MAG: hypothetical protein IJ415_02705 [Clostridia bacterium]|nr:hypothetical protein [Clostridia bacterium]